MKQVVMYTDGACRGNPGPGGWGVSLAYNGHEKHLKGSEAQTTNNRMELMAAISGLEKLSQGCHVDLYTDSRYVMDGITRWIDGWKRNGWKNSAKKPVKNADLWQRLDAVHSVHEVDWHWVKGHTGDPGNELADQLANEAIDEMLRG